MKRIDALEFDCDISDLPGTFVKQMSQTDGPTFVNVYETCDPAYLRQLREAAGMDQAVLAKTACLSLAQVRALEQEKTQGVFYSDAIRRQAYKRLLMILGAEPPRATVVEPLEQTAADHQAQLQSLDQIVAMSRQPSIIPNRWQPLWSLRMVLQERKQAVGSGLLLALALALLVWNWPQGVGKGMMEHVSAVVSAPAQAPKPEPAVIPPELPAAPQISATASTAVAVMPPTAVVVPSVTASSAQLVAVPVSPPISVAANAHAATSTACAYSNEPMPNLTPATAVKPAKYVYIVSTADVQLCVVDAARQATVVNLKSGESRSVYGAAPWQISGSHLAKVQIYFQGWRVTLPGDELRRLTLLEKSTSP